MNKKTLVIGASENPERYSNMAIKNLRKHHHDVVAIGLKDGNVAGVPITTDKKQLQHIDTVTLYLNPQRQADYYQYIHSLHPKRVIFNPGTENKEFEKTLSENGIEVIEACTLVMLNTQQY